MDDNIQYPRKVLTGLYMYITFVLFKIHPSNFLCCKCVHQWWSIPNFTVFGRKLFVWGCSVWIKLPAIFLAQFHHGGSAETALKEHWKGLQKGSSGALEGCGPLWLLSGSSSRCLSLPWGGFWPLPGRTPPYRSRVRRRWSSCRTWCCPYRQGSRRGLPGMVAWPDTELNVQTRNKWFFNFYTVLSLILCRTGQHFPRVL